MRGWVSVGDVGMGGGFGVSSFVVSACVMRFALWLRGGGWYGGEGAWGGGRSMT